VLPDALLTLKMAREICEKNASLVGWWMGFVLVVGGNKLKDVCQGWVGVC
jgi:hypothetical protein